MARTQALHVTCYENLTCDFGLANLKMFLLNDVEYFLAKCQCATNGIPDKIVIDIYGYQWYLSNTVHSC